MLPFGQQLSVKSIASSNNENSAIPSLTNTIQEACQRTNNPQQTLRMLHREETYDESV